MKEIVYIDRKTNERKIEKIYGHFFIALLYGNPLFSWMVLPFIARIPLFSQLYGAFQKSVLSRKKIAPFIRTFAIDTSEFLDPVESFTCFNDFFIRRLKPSVRPIHTDERGAILPADGRYLVYPDISQVDGFWVKGQKFSLDRLLLDHELALRYQSGAMVIARLCPVDYHRFHFPSACVPSPARLIHGPLFSVNPIALVKNIHYLSENKRMVTRLKTAHFGTVLFVEVGATYVGSIHQVYQAEKMQEKGAEKGYFSFGGSCILLLFEKGRIQFDADLVEHSAQRIETLGLLGQSLGRSHILKQNGF